MVKKVKGVLLVFIAACAVTACQHSATSTVEPAGELKNVDTSKDSLAIKHLLGKKKKDAAKTANEVSRNPANYSPPVYYAMSSYLFSSGYKESAVRWFYAGQIRARYDANRCTDKSAGAAVGVLNQKFGPQINEYAFQNINLLEKAVKETVYWSLSTPHHYDQRWINLHGMEAFTESGSKQPSLPESEWEDIRISTHTKYLQEFEQALEQLKNQT